MCTAMTLHTQSHEIFFGRTMDFSHDIIPQLYIVPSSYVWHNTLNNNPIKNPYSFIGLGQELDGILGFFDGVNEKGFAAAVLYFAGYAHYASQVSPKTALPIASIDFLQYILGRCSSVKELPYLLKDINLVGIPDPVTGSIAPLHWIAADKNGDCAVVEPTINGLTIRNNPIGVMANSPDFSWHLTNLRNYMGASPVQTEEVCWDSLRLTPFGQAGGTVPLPGGFTSPERFVRTAYLKAHLPEPKNSSEALAACFHIMESVSIPKGAVLTSRNTYDYTKYTAFINTNTCEYFFKTYDDINLKTASLTQGLNLYKTRL
ncbi:choloylglycine hydrolase family protein [Anaerocolumna sp. AGMB13020]|uniref:choloylglycine hydrolase family protein n=1 Tax=Anaerocolumna sp. AGMB13020 TaxID=3081750 RepID=UPI002955760C|nr:choloylglycine hydrolase family protein [Anaerocolumna sp. AGMB13020]WOO37893.1 choloylglycine hydrolase family protein [Anaerocolumna sp. AGMB13020]